jgi:hypothetical protein
LLAVAIISALSAPSALSAQASASRTIYVDNQGVLRWQADRREVTLFGANYVLPGASDYRAAGYVGADRKRLIEQDMAHFARMGWDGIRLTFWGDWEATDSLGNLLRNDHLDLLDWLVARARERGISMLFSPIQLYQSTWPDALRDTSPPGFARRYDRSRMGTDPAAIAAQANYLRQILDHVNPYTGIAYKDEPAILFIELVNEPVHHPEDLEGSVRYINTLVDAVRSTGCTKLITYNVSQDFRIGEAIRRSKAQGITYGWYPTGLNSGRELEGNFLRTVDDYPHLRDPLLARLPRIVYEFDVPDTRSAAMYAAVARTFRAGGIQFAAMFSYDMLATASRNLGWQTHYLNLVYTPRKAMGAIIAAEAMRRLPRGTAWGPYPENTRFGDFRISGEPDHAELVAADAFLHSATTASAPKDPAALSRIAGVGSSPVVQYGGEGIYFLDRLRPGLWRLEVYPDAVPVRDPFEMPSPTKIVTRAISRAWPMTVTLPDLGEAFSVQAIRQPERSLRQPERSEGAEPRAVAGTFTVTPGVYLLSASGAVDPATLPQQIRGVGLAEYHGPPPDTLPMAVQVLSGTSVLSGRDATVLARVADDTPPDSVALFLRPAGRPFQRSVPMRPAGGYAYAGTIPSSTLEPGPYQFVIAAFRNGAATTFPSGTPRMPWDWDWHQQAAWPLEVVTAGTPLRLFDPGTDADHLAFSRIGDGGRRGLFRIGRSSVTGQPVFHFESPRAGSGPEGDDYTASLVVRQRVLARQETITAAEVVRLRLRGLGARQTLLVTLMEVDGTSWVAPVTVDSAWQEVELPLGAFAAGRGAMLPQGFPQQWNYWVGPAAGRGGAGDRLRPAQLERIQLSLRREDGVVVAPEQYGVEVEWVALGFAGAGGR